MTYQESKLLALFRTADDRAKEDAIKTLEAHQRPVQEAGKVIAFKREVSSSDFEIDPETMAECTLFGNEKSSSPLGETESCGQRKRKAPQSGTRP